MLESTAPCQVSSLTTLVVAPKIWLAHNLEYNVISIAYEFKSTVIYITATPKLSQDYRSQDHHPYSYVSYH